MMMGAERLLTLLCVTFCALHEATAASLSLTQNRSNSAPAVLQQSGEPSGEFYKHGEHHCKKCPAGSQVVSHCTRPEAPSECQVCDKETFAKSMNSLEKCVPCKTCRRFDEVELQPCTSTSNTQCACKNGTFCSPSFPCEACNKCTARCPDGERMVQPCSPTSDIQCLPYTTSQTPWTPETGSHGREHIIGWSVAGCLVVVFLGLVFLYRDKFCCCPGGSPTGSTANRLHTKTVQCLQRNCSERPQEERDNMWNVHIDQASQHSSQSHTDSSTSETVPLQATPPPEEEGPVVAPEERRKLVPANGKDPVSALGQSFETFINEVPVSKWNQYMRALGLTHNEICHAQMNERLLSEQQFQMLQTWLNKNGREATLDVLLETLCNIGYKGVEERLRDTLTSQGIYVYAE